MTAIHIPLIRIEGAEFRGVHYELATDEMQLVFRRPEPAEVVVIPLALSSMSKLREELGAPQSANQRADFAEEMAKTLARTAEALAKR